MEREIKFRAFNPQINKMAYNVFKTYNGDIVFVSENDHETEVRWIPIADKEPVLMQFTGLKDKNGKEIYENDIFEVAGNKEYIVKYSNGMTSNHEWYGGTFILFLDDDTFFPFDEYAMTNGIVIGNIYLNTN